MSKLKLRLAGLTFILLSMLAMGGKAVAEDCLDVMTYAGPPGTSECYEFSNNCIPQGWVTYLGGCPF
jgi:hypothetical protein